MPPPLSFWPSRRHLFRRQWPWQRSRLLKALSFVCTVAVGLALVVGLFHGASR